MRHVELILPESFNQGLILLTRANFLQPGPNPYNKDPVNNQDLFLAIRVWPIQTGPDPYDQGLNNPYIQGLILNIIAWSLQLRPDSNNQIRNLTHKFSRFSVDLYLNTRHICIYRYCRKKITKQYKTTLYYLSLK